MNNWVEIHIFGSITEGNIKINLDNYKDEKILDLLYLPQIKKTLIDVIKTELEKQNEDD